MNSIIEVAQLIQVCEEIKGRVKIQKIVHILQESGFSVFDEDYSYLHHGPYSSDLAREIDQLEAGGYVTESPEEVGDYVRYVYRPTEHLRKASEGLWDDDAPAWQAQALELKDKRSSELEAISTIMFLRRRKFTGGRLQERFGELKSHLRDQFEPCLHEARKFQKLPDGT